MVFKDDRVSIPESKSALNKIDLPRLNSANITGTMFPYEQTAYNRIHITLFFTFINMIHITVEKFKQRYPINWDNGGSLYHITYS